MIRPILSICRVAGAAITNASSVTAINFFFDRYRQRALYQQILEDGGGSHSRAMPFFLFVFPTIAHCDGVCIPLSAFYVGHIRKKCQRYEKRRNLLQSCKSYPKQPSSNSIVGEAKRERDLAAETCPPLRYQRLGSGWQIGKPIRLSMRDKTRASEEL